MLIKDPRLKYIIGDASSRYVLDAIDALDFKLPAHRMYVRSHRLFCKALTPAHVSAIAHAEQVSKPDLKRVKKSNVDTIMSFQWAQNSAAW